MSTSGPPELPGLIAASVCSALMHGGVSCRSPPEADRAVERADDPGRHRACRGRAASRSRPPPGRPAARRSCPASTGVRPDTFCALITARSKVGARPTIVAGAVVPSLERPRSASRRSPRRSTTWLLVRISPSLLRMIPEPSPLGAAGALDVDLDDAGQHLVGDLLDRAGRCGRRVRARERLVEHAPGSRPARRRHSRPRRRPAPPSSAATSATTAIGTTIRGDRAAPGVAAGSAGLPRAVGAGRRAAHRAGRAAGRHGWGRPAGCGESLGSAGCRGGSGRLSRAGPMVQAGPLVRGGPAGSGRAAGRGAAAGPPAGRLRRVAAAGRAVRARCGVRFRCARRWP